MASEVEIPVDASGFDRLISTLQGVQQASKATGDAFKKAFATEVLVQSLNNVGSAMGGVEGKAVTAVGTIVQGFASGGPIGGALAATSVAFKSLFEVIDYGNERLKEQDAILAKIATERVEKAAQVRKAEQAAIDALAAANDASNEREESARKTREEAAKKRAQERFDYEMFLAEQSAALWGIEYKAAQERETRDLQSFLDETTALMVADAERKADAIKAEVDRQAEERRRIAEVAQFASDADALTADLLDDLVEKSDAAAVAIGQNFVPAVVDGVNAITAMDAAQIGAALSADDLAQTLVASSARAVSSALQSIAQRETVEALANAAAGFGRLAVGDVPGSGLHFQSAGLHAAAATAAGAGAVALNTAASAVAPGSSGAPAQRPSGGVSPGGTSASGPQARERNIIVNTGLLLSTADEIGAQVERVQRQARRYGR